MRMSVCVCTRVCAHVCVSAGIEVRQGHCSLTLPHSAETRSFTEAGAGLEAASPSDAPAPVTT